MAAVSHLKNKKEAKHREGIEKVSGIVNNARVPRPSQSSFCLLCLSDHDEVFTLRIIRSVGKRLPGAS